MNEKYKWMQKQFWFGINEKQNRIYSIIQIIIALHCLRNGWNKYCNTK